MIYLVLGLIYNIGKSFSEQALFIFHMVSVTACMIIIVVCARINLRSINFAMLFIMIGRITETFVVLYMVDKKAPGFELIDRKELSDSI